MKARRVGGVRVKARRVGGVRVKTEVGGVRVKTEVGGVRVKPGQLDQDRWTRSAGAMSQL